MRLTVLILVLFVRQISAQDSSCNYVGLVKCFINILDEWAWTLYELKDNVVTIKPDQCEHLKELEKCIKDDLPIPHRCSHQEMVEVSNSVTDLLTHRKQSGSFLRSYYLLHYACSSEGQEILSSHRECLKSERIGEMTLSAGTYLSKTFLEAKDKDNRLGDEEICDEVNGKLQKYVGAMKGICSKHEAAQLMCKSLINMFKGLHADRLGETCELDCKIPEPEEEKTEEAAENANPVQSEPDALSPADSSSFIPLFTALAIPILLR